MHNSISNIFSHFDKTLIGMVSNRNKRKYESVSYKRGEQKKINKRRAKNKVARKSRRLNQIRSKGLHCKFYS